MDVSKNCVLTQCLPDWKFLSAKKTVIFTP